MQRIHISGALVSKKEKDFIDKALKKTDQILASLKKCEQEEIIQKKIMKSYSQSDTKPKIQNLFSIERDYSLLLKCSQIKLNKQNVVSIQAYMQQYFVFDMSLFVFPLYLQITKLSNKGLLYIGFDKQFPGIQTSKNKKQDIIDSFKSQIKVPINSNQVIQVKSPISKFIHRLYFMFSSSKKSFGLIFKIKQKTKSSKIQLNQMQMNPQFRTSINFIPQYKQLLNKNFKRKIRVKTDLSPKFSMTKTSYIEKLQRLSLNEGDENLKNENNKWNKSKTFHKNIVDSQFLKTSLTFFENQNNDKDKIFLQNKQIKSQTMMSFLRKTLNFSSQQRQQMSRSNYLELQIWRQKTSKLNELVEKFKSEIKYFKNIHDQNKLKQKKILKHLVNFISIAKFFYKSQIMYVKRKNKLQKFFVTIFFVNRFIKRFKKGVFQSQKLVKNQNNRIVYGLLPISQFLASNFYQKCESKSNKIFNQVFISIFCPLIINITIQKSEIYVKKIKKVQVYYKQRYNCQIKMLQFFCKETLNNLLNKHQNFKKFEKQFIEQRIIERLIKSYLKDQNLKHNQKIKQYQQGLIQKQKIIALKRRLENDQKKRQQYFRKARKIVNKQGQKRRDLQRSIQKKRGKINNDLQIPKDPIKPAKGTFRNINILKSMIRNWFQLQNHIWLKQQKAKLWY